LLNLFAATASVDELSGNSKQVWQIPDAAYTDLSSWWWAEKPLETCRALTIIKSIIQRCILLVMFKNTLTMHSPMNVTFSRRTLLQSVTQLGCYSYNTTEHLFRNCIASRDLTTELRTGKTW
jgi:hypothetical protein